MFHQDIHQTEKMNRIHMIHLYLIILHQLTVVRCQAQTDGSTRDTCCQAGIPGIPGAGGMPGSPGNNGSPGRDGLRGELGGKGERGERGEIGRDGPSGPQGPSGDRGEQGSRGLQGLPGKLGPRGIVGEEGRPGPSGERGQKGEAGGNQRSAFSVGKMSNQYGSVGDTLTFQHVETNIGNPYSSTDHRFTCQIAGTYVFMFTIASAYYTQEPIVDLVKDGTGIARAIVRKTDSGRMYLQSSQSVVLQLAVSNQVWLQFVSNNEHIYSENDKYTTFAGFLLYEDI